MYALNCLTLCEESHGYHGYSCAHEYETRSVEDLQQQAREILIPELSSPWPHTLHPFVEEARSAANEWDVYHFLALAGTKRFSKNMESNLIDILAAGFYSTSPLWDVEFGMETIYFYYVLDGEV